MIGVEEALALIRNAKVTTKVDRVPLLEGLDCCLAVDVTSPIDMPTFNQSGMDGYAVFWEVDRMEYELIGEVAAGSSFHPRLTVGQAVRIFTGAMVPDTANLVVQQEWTTVENKKLKILKPVEIGKNIRLKGEQIKAGDIAMEKGALIYAAAVGFLAGLGITEATIYRKPTIGLITTGNELVKPGQPLRLGQIYESNAVMLIAALKQHHFTDVIVKTVDDDYDSTKNTIQKTLEQVDFLILTGGISVGDYDFVGKALNEIGVEELFYKVNQKPGKPLYVGICKHKLIAALPGNPAAALTCFYRYVLPGLNLMAGKGFLGLEELELPLGEAYEKKEDRAEFLKAFIAYGTVRILGNQSSAMLNSFAKANALVYIPSEVNKVEKMELVKVLKLD